jgi:hypothetical protein
LRKVQITHERKKKYKEKNCHLAHREGRTRSLQIGNKNLTFYPIELGGQLIKERKVRNYDFGIALYHAWTRNPHNIGQELTEQKVQEFFDPQANTIT